MSIKKPVYLLALLLLALSVPLLSAGYYPPYYRVTVIQFADPVTDPMTITCGHPDVQDAWLVSGVPEGPWGNCDQLPAATYKLYVGYVQGSRDGEYRSIIKFIDLSAISANAEVESAFLTIKQTWCQGAYPYSSMPVGCSGNTLGIQAHKVTTAWGEKTVRWMEMPGFDPVPLSTVRVKNVLGAELRMDVTAAFREWLADPSSNHGVMLIPNPVPFNDFFRGRSHDTVCNEFWWCAGGQGEPPGADAPKLTVTWR